MCLGAESFSYRRLNGVLNNSCESETLIKQTKNIPSGRLNICPLEGSIAQLPEMNWET